MRLGFRKVVADMTKMADGDFAAFDEATEPFAKVVGTISTRRRSIGCCGCGFGTVGAR
jgi:hypothetical protein